MPNDKQKKLITVTVAERPVEIALNFPRTAAYFERCIAKEEPIAFAELTEEHIVASRSRYRVEDDDAYLEFCELASAISDALTPFGVSAFHGAAFLMNGRAWIFTGPSGTGKTTQYVLWKSLFGEDITMICGDKPFLERGEDGCVTVHSSIWRGKENMGNALKAPLGGIICLLQSERFYMKRLKPAEAVMPLYRQFLSLRGDTETVSGLADMASAIVASTPVYLMENRGSREDALCGYEYIVKEEKDHE